MFGLWCSGKVVHVPGLFDSRSRGSQNSCRGMWPVGNHRIHGAAIYGNIYHPYGDGSIPMKIPFLVGWTSINPSYFGVHQGYKVLTHSHIPPMLADIPAPWIRHGKVHCPLLWHRFATTHCMQHVAYVLTQAHGFWAREWDPLIFPKGLVLARTSTQGPVISGTGHRLKVNFTGTF